MTPDNAEILSSLPPKTDLADGVLAADRVRISWLNEDDTTKLHAALTTLQEVTRLPLVELLKHYNIEPGIYLNHVRSVQLERDGNERVSNRVSVAKMSLREKVELFGRLESARLSGSNISEACQAAGVPDSFYFEADRNIKKWKAELSRTAMPAKAQPRTIASEDEQRLIYDAVPVLMSVTGCTAQQAAEALGVTMQDVEGWKPAPEQQEADVEGPQEPKKKNILRTAQKLHLVQVADYLTKHTALQVDDVFKGMGVERHASSWSKTANAVTTLAEARNGNVLLEDSVVRDLIAELQMTRRAIQPWLKEVGLYDAEAMLYPGTGTARYDGLARERRELLPLWKLYQESEGSDGAALASLQSEYQPYVDSIARDYDTATPGAVTYEQLQSQGFTGFMDTLRLFDLNLGNKYTTYAPYRIKGAMQDALRDIDFVPRTVRRTQARLEAAEEEAKRTITGRSITDKDMADILGVTVFAYLNMRRLVQRTTVESLDRQVGGTDGQKTEVKYSTIEANTSQGIPVSDRRDFMEKIHTGLSETERRIIELYYREDLTMAQIGEELDLSESRISQMHTALMRRLRQRMQDSNGTGDILDSVGQQFLGTRVFEFED